MPAVTKESTVDEFGDPLPEFTKPKWKCYLAKNAGQGIAVHLRNEGARVAYLPPMAAGEKQRTTVYVQNRPGWGHGRRGVGDFIADYCTSQGVSPLDVQYWNMTQWREVYKTLHKRDSWW